MQPTTQKLVADLLEIVDDKHTTVDRKFDDIHHMIAYMGLRMMPLCDYYSFVEYTVAIPQPTYPRAGSNMVYPALKLAGEAGELADKIGKHWRNTDVATCPLFAIRGDSVPATEREKMALELGDVLWYVNALANELNYTLGEIAQMNVDKLQDRARRGVINGEGDNR